MPPVTSRVPGDGSGTLTYTIPGSGLDVETVRVSVDATAAGGPVTATVTITDQSGVVIATKPQNATIPAGAVGSATWALRLDDETAAATGGGIQFDTWPQAGDYLYTETNDVTQSSPNSYGTEFHDRTATGLGIGIISDVNGVSLQGENVELLQYDPPGVLLGSLNSLINLANTGVQITAGLDTSTASIQNQSANNVVLGFNYSGAGTGKVIVSAGGFTIFEFWADGSVHGLAAVGAITWDL